MVSVDVKHHVYLFTSEFKLRHLTINQRLEKSFTGQLKSSGQKQSDVMAVRVILVLACVVLVGHGNVVAGHSPVSSAGIRSGTERLRKGGHHSMGQSGGNHAAGRWPS